jgi:hypothetical protein
MDLFEDDLQLRIHGAERLTEASIVIVVDFVGFQLESKEAIRYQL